MIDADGIYKSPRGETYRLERHPVNCFFSFSSCGETKGPAPAELSGNFTDMKYITAAIAAFEARPEVKFVQTRNAEKAKIGKT